jgi:hypothetical protein
MLNKQAKIKPAKMPKPPKEGIGIECTFLSSGTSYNFFRSATVITTGIARKVTVKDIVIQSITSNMRFNWSDKNKVYSALKLNSM